MRVLITGGASGQLRAELRRTVPDGVVLCEVTDAGARERLDITDAAAVAAAFAQARPDVIVNAAAYTAVDRAESEPALARRVNVDGVRHLAEAAARHDARMVHVSTDFVFGGAALTAGEHTLAHGAPIPEHALTAPLSVYGRTKRDGEQVLADTLGTQGCTVRTSWVYSAHGANFVRTMLRLMAEREEIGVVADQIGSPTWARSLAVALWRVVEQDPFGAGADKNADADASVSGADGSMPGGPPILHWSGAGVASWYDLAVAVCEEGRALGLLERAVRVLPLTTADYPTPAIRPASSVLETSRTRRLLGLPAVHWREELRTMLEELR